MRTRNYIMALFAVLFMASCEKDPVLKPSEITGSYSAENVSLKVSGAAFDLNGTIVIGGNTGSTETLVLVLPEKIIPGEGELTFTNMKFESNGTFTGVNANNDRKIHINGAIVGDRMLLDVKPEYSGEIIGTWNFEAPGLVDDPDGFFPIDTSTVMICRIETATDSIVFFGNTVHQDALGQIINPILGQSLLRSYDEETGAYTGALKNLRFNTDGNVDLEYNSSFMSGATFVGLQKGIIRWYQKDGKLYLIPNLNLITRGISTEGIAIGQVTVENGVLEIFVTKESLAPFFGLVNSLVKDLPDDILGNSTPLLKMAIQDLTNIATSEDTERFDFGIRFVKE